MSANSNILPIPFRRTHNLLLSDAIKSYISTKYDQHPDTFARDLEIIDQLRKDAVTSLEPHPSGTRKLQAYAAQLVWMGGKFPVDVRTIIVITISTLEQHR
jgi:programmed cell death 6-interacting protein